MEGVVGCGGGALTGALTETAGGGLVGRSCSSADEDEDDGETSAVGAAFENGMR